MADSQEKTSEKSDIVKADLEQKEAETKASASGKEMDSVLTANEESGGENKEPSTSSGEPVDYLTHLLSQLGIKKAEAASSEEDTVAKPEQLLDELTLDGVAQYIKSGKCKKIIVMTGAGLSTAAGIPDFRSPGTGLYDNLQKYNLPSPQSVFEIGFFKTNPEPFFALAKELYPGKYKPTVGHYFIKLLADKELLLRNYTQNEYNNSVTSQCLSNLVAILATFMLKNHGQKIPSTNKPINFDEVFADRVPKCQSCETGVVKPDIVFFGEALPSRFGRLVTEDMHQCDLLIIMGTSLVVHPFASLVDRVPPVTPRLLINKEKCSQQQDFMSLLLGIKSGLQFDSEENYRDVAWLGMCDDGCIALAELLGWKDELLQLAESNSKLLDEQNQTEVATNKKAVSSTKEKL